MDKFRDKIINWIEDQKNDETILTHVLKIAYIMGKKQWIHAIITSLSGIFIPILWEKEKWILFGISLFIMILDILYAYVCTEYQSYLFVQRRFASELLSEQSALIKSINIEIQNNPNWKSTIFKTVSGLVCGEIYRIFKEILKCEVRVSIEYVFNKLSNTTSKTEKHIKMAGRKSHNRGTVKKSIPLSKRNRYYSYKIFINNNRGINVLEEEQLKNAAIWYKNPANSTNVKKYIGIAVSLDDEEDVRFILQIDCLDDNILEEYSKDDDIRQFIEKHFMTYINIVSLAYLLNLNRKKEIPEV